MSEETVKKPGKGKKSGESFSILLGKRRDYVEEKPLDKEEKKPAPVKETVEKKPPRKLTLKELLAKRHETELFLSSLDDARQQAKFPEYTYQRLKKRNEVRLSMIDREIKRMKAGMPRVPEAAAVETTAGRKIIEEVNALLEKNLRHAPSRDMLNELGNKIRNVETALRKIPYLKSGVVRLKSEIGEYKSIIDDLKSHEKSLSEKLTGIRDSLSSLSARVIEDIRGKEENEALKQQSVDKRITDLSRKVNAVSRKFEDMNTNLGSRINQLTVLEEVKTEGYVNDLKNQIEGIRSDLSGYVKREELGKTTQEPAKPAEKAVKIKKRVDKDKAKVIEQSKVDVNDLVDFVGKDVIIECDVSLMKRIDEDGMKIYWHNIRDKTGDSILTSYEKLPKKKVKIRGKVKKTNTGSVYVLFKKIIS